LWSCGRIRTGWESLGSEAVEPTAARRCASTCKCAVRALGVFGFGRRHVDRRLARRVAPGRDVFCRAPRVAPRAKKRSTVSTRLSVSVHLCRWSTVFYSERRSAVGPNCFRNNSSARIKKIITYTWRGDTVRHGRTGNPSKIRAWRSAFQTCARTRDRFLSFSFFRGRNARGTDDDLRAGKPAPGPLAYNNIARAIYKSSGITSGGGGGGKINIAFITRASVFTAKTNIYVYIYINIIVPI